MGVDSDALCACGCEKSFRQIQEEKELSVSKVQVDRGAMSLASAAYLDTLTQDMPEYKRHEIMIWAYEWTKVNQETWQSGDMNVTQLPSLDDLRQALAERDS